MTTDVSDFDRWQVFEVHVDEASGRGTGWADTTKRIADENCIPLEVRFDHENCRYLLALPTAQHYDELMDKVDRFFQSRFDTRMNQLKERYRIRPVSLPVLTTE